MKGDRVSLGHVKFTLRVSSSLKVGGGCFPEKERQKW